VNQASPACKQTGAPHGLALKVITEKLDWNVREKVAGKLCFNEVRQWRDFWALIGPARRISGLLGLNALSSIPALSGLGGSTSIERQR
jgi:hypothetical protein